MGNETFEDLVDAFFKAGRIAVWGVENEKSGAGMWVVRRLRKSGARVFAVNPVFTTDLASDRAASLTEIEPPADAVLLYVDPPEAAQAAEDCIAANVPLVWLHDAMSPGAATPEVLARLSEAGTRVIPGLCPMLYLKPVDPAHFCLRWVLRWKGKVKRVHEATADPGV